MRPTIASNGHASITVPHRADVASLAPLVVCRGAETGRMSKP
jgi:hypothetical protein